jgi:hypothetical protein
MTGLKFSFSRYRGMSRKLLALATVTAGGLVLTTAAYSAAPKIVRSSFSDSGTDSALCGFPIVLDFEGTLSVTFFFDGEGSIIRRALHASDVAIATNPSNGKTLMGHEVLNIEAREETEARMGLALHFNVTGGSALIDAGRIVIGRDGNAVFVSGNHEFLEGDLTSFCSTLA